MVIEAARSALVGVSMEQIVDQVRSMIPFTRMLQTADTLKYLYMGGRIGRARHLLGSLLNIKPLISMQDGEIIAVGQAHSRDEAFRLITRLIEKAAGASGKIKAAYMHAAAREETLKLKYLVEEWVNVVESMVAELSPALGIHSGSGTAGVCYFPLTG